MNFFKNWIGKRKERALKRQELEKKFAGDLSFAKERLQYFLKRRPRTETTKLCITFLKIFIKDPENESLEDYHRLYDLNSQASCLNHNIRIAKIILMEKELKHFKVTSGITWRDFKKVCAKNEI